MTSFEMPSLRCTELSWSQQQNRILDQVNCELHAGEVLALIGPNGAGKSSLLKALSGDITELSGLVVLNGRSLKDWSPTELAQQRAVMPQQVQLDFAFKVAEVVSMGWLGPDSNARWTQLVQVMADFDISHLAQRNYLTLSGGEQQRVHLARVWLQLLSTPNRSTTRPGYLLLDEATSSLDLAHQHQVFKLLCALAKNQNIGVLVVLHDLNLAARYADKVLLMHQGRVMAQGLVDEVMQAEILSETFGLALDVCQPQDAPLMIWPARE